MLNLGRCRLFAETPASFSTRTIDLVRGSGVIDMLGLPTLEWNRFEQWQSNPASFTDAEFRKLRQSGIQTFHPAVAFTVPDAHEITTQWLGKWNRLISQRPDCFYRVDSLNSPNAKVAGKVGIVLGMQDANHFRRADDVDAFYAAGQRVSQLTYNTSNALGDGCMVAHDRGLTPFGMDIVARMNATGMAVDISHSGERTSLDAIAVSKKPVLITHSNCRTLAPQVARCKSDAVIQAAAKSGGVLGLTHVRHFVKTGDPVSMDDLLDHFDHAVRLAGVEHVGLGSDTDLSGRDRAGAPHRYDIERLNHVGRVYELTEGLVNRGYTDAHIGLLLGGNFRRVLSEIWTSPPAS